jgi:parallel beta-helix repeat protein
MMTLRVPAQYATIQDAIVAAYDGCTVLVEPGRYMENLDFLGKAITLKSSEGAQWTFLNGKQSGATVTFTNDEGSDSVLEGFTIVNGQYGSGGGVYCDAASPTIRNCVIANNFATRGGGIYCYYSSPTVTNNTIYNNDASAEGGGLFAKGDSFPKVRNTILWNNEAPSGPEIGTDGGVPSVLYCDVEGGWPGTGNIDANPKLVEPSELDMHLKWTSPCRDAGWNSAAGLPDFDFEGDPRKTDGTADMGADEFHKRFYYHGEPYPGYSITGRIVGVPGSAPVGFWMGLGVLEIKWYSPMYGTWYLAPPFLFSGLLGPIPADGVMDLPAPVPGTPPAPYELYLQAFIGDAFSNLLTLRILVM